MKPTVCILLLVASLLGACSAVSETAYNAGRVANLRSCERLSSMQDRNACVKSHDASYDAYDKSRQETMTGANENHANKQSEASKRESSLCFKRQSTGELVCPN